MPRLNATIDELREDIIWLRAEVNQLKEKFDHKKRPWWKNPSYITLIVLVVGSLFQVWLNRPVVDFQLVAASTSDYYTISPPYQPFKPQAHQFFFDVQNTGQTDITLDVTIVATNATISPSQNGQFRDMATERIFIPARSNWAMYAFYVKVDEKALSFGVYLLRHQLVASPDWLTTQVDAFATYNPINAQQLTWAVQPELNPLVYELQA